MAEEVVFVNLDVAKKTMDMADSIFKNMRQFENDPDGIASTIHYIAGLKPSQIIIEAAGNYEKHLAEALQANHVLVVIVNPRQVRDFARVTGVLAKTAKIDAGILALFGFKIKPKMKPIPNKQVREMGNFFTRRRQLIKMLTSKRNRLLQDDEDIHPVLKFISSGQRTRQMISMITWTEKSVIVPRGWRKTIFLRVSPESGKWYQPLS